MTTDTTIDFAPLLAMRDEFQRIGHVLCARIVAGDTDAIATGRALLATEERLERTLKAKLATMYDQTSEYVTENERRADDGFGWVVDAIRATGDLCTAVDDPDQYVAPVRAS